MIRKLIVGSSKIYFTIFATTVIGFFIVLISVGLFTDYLDATGFDNFIQSLNAFLGNIL